MTVQMRSFAHSVCVCVCVRERERESARERVTLQQSVQHIRNHLNRGLCANTYQNHLCVCHVTLFPSRLELMVKLRTLLTVFTFILKAKACDYGKEHYISDLRLEIVLVVVGQSQSTVPVGQSEQTALVGRRGFEENEAVWERRGIEDLQ